MLKRYHQVVLMTERIWRKSRLAHSIALVSVVAMAATGTFAVEDSSKMMGAGLSGIFPPTPPSDLKEDEFSKLDGNWAEWSKGAAATVADFYSKLDGSDPASQRKALGVLKVKQDVMRRALDDSRYASLHGPLTALNNSLALRIEFAEAALDTLEIDGSHMAATKIKSTSNAVLSAIQTLESHLSPIPNGTLWLPYFKVDEVKDALKADPEGTAAHAAATKAQAALKSRDYVLDENQKAFTRHSTFNAYATAIDQYLAVAPSGTPAEATAKLRTELKAMALSLDNYASTGERAGDLRQAFARVRLVSADGGNRMASAVQERLFNYNFRILITENFLNRLIAENRIETGRVNDCILGAKVDGCQITNTTVSVDLKPSASTARIDLMLNGNIRSNTQGVTPQATVYTAGNHTFHAKKEINFDGTNFSTSPATISVQPHNTTTGISTQLSGIPILGRIANSIASDQVAAKQGEAEAIAASRVSDGVLPRFNSEVDSNFANQGRKLNTELFSGLRSAGLYPDAYSYQSSDRILTINARVMTANQIGADVPESRLMAVTGATALLHETVVNNAIDQMGLAGQTLTEPELRAKIETFLSSALNRPFKFEAPPPVEPEDDDSKKLNGIIFAPTDPIRIRVENGELSIIIRAGFKQEGKEDIPMREITVPITFEVAGSSINISRGNVLVAAAEGQGGGVGINAVVRKKIQAVLPDRNVNNNIEIKNQNKTLIVHVSKINMVDGWIAVGID